jgi:tetratricopeptide (TPR) repeat protein
MKNLHRYLLSCLVLLFFASCGQSGREIAQLMSQAEAAMEEQPDSALFYLNTIRDTAGLQQAQRHNYHLLRIQAKDKTDQDICADTVILQVKEYYLQVKNFSKATLSAFYCGRVYQSCNKVPQALEAFLEAETLAGYDVDNKRKGQIQYNISSIYYTMGTDYDKAQAIAHVKKAVDCFRQSDDTAGQIEALNLQGLCFLLVQQPDSAFHCQQKALDIAVALNDTLKQAAILHNISSSYRKKGDLAQAKTYALMAMNNGDRDTIKSLLNRAYIHYDYHEYDSAAGYARRILQYGSADSARSIPVSVYYLLAKIAENKNDYQRALEYTNNYYALVDEIHKKQKDQSIAGIREQYELELAQIEKQKAIIRASRKHLAAFLVASLSIIAVLVVIIGFIRYKKQFSKTKEDNDRLYKLRIDWVKKQELIEQALKTTLKDKKVISELKDKIYKSLYENDVWGTVYTILNEQHHGAVERLQQQLSLPEQHFRICCFAYVGFSDKEIAACLQLSPNTVKSKKNAIRKHLKVSERGSIRKFMTQKLQTETNL